MRLRRSAISLAAPIVFAAFTPHSVSAQSYQCRVPPRISVPPVSQNGKTRRMPITGYTLALSWSPEFCRTQKASPRSTAQCSGSNGRFGFIVHGLWPEGRSTYPQWCGTARKVSPQTARANLCMMPSPYLMAHEWAKHGSCMIRSPDAYFKITRILWGSLTMPDMARLSYDKSLTADDIRKRFVAVNGKPWATNYIGVKVNNRGWLRELYVCYNKDFMPARCKPSQYGARGNSQVKIWRGR